MSLSTFCALMGFNLGVCYCAAVRYLFAGDPAIVFPVTISLLCIAVLALRIKGEQ